MKQNDCEDALSLSASTVTEETVFRAIISHFLSLGAKASEDARWLVSILPADVLPFFRAEVCNAITAKAGNPVKARKIFLSMGKTARAIFGPEYARTKKMLDAQSRAVS